MSSLNAVKDLKNQALVFVSGRSFTGLLAVGRLFWRALKKPGDPSALRVAARFHGANLDLNKNNYLHNELDQLSQQPN